MAYKLVFPRPYLNMPYIWNVSDTVGDTAECRNNATDVDLVTLLIRAWINSNADVLIPRLHQSCKVSLVVNGNMDITKAYWIRMFNEIQHDQGRLSLAQSGMISRARKAFYGEYTWSIVYLNRSLFLKNKMTWEEFPTFAGDLPPALTRELLTKTSP